MNFNSIFFQKKVLGTFKLLVFILFPLVTWAQSSVKINPYTDEHFFQRQDISVLADSAGSLSFKKVSSPQFSHLFVPNNITYPISSHDIAYWYKIKINYQTGIDQNHALIEFFDQTTDSITAYMPTADGKYQVISAGAAQKFSDRQYAHKNFEFLINAQPKGEHYYYFRVRSANSANVIMVYRKMQYFIYYALNEYLLFGLFYGIIIIFSLHNLLMFTAVKQRQYLFYVCYLVSLGIYEMSSDGIAYQYLWPNSPHWNEYAFGIALYCISVSALIFTRELLHVKTQAPIFYKLINYTLILRTCFLLACLLINKDLFYLRYLEIIPLTVVFSTGIHVWLKGFKPARFLVLGYAIIYLGFIAKITSVLGWHDYLHLPGFIANYCLSFSFIFEMLFLSFAISDQVRILRTEKENAQDEIIHQMNLNAEMRESENRNLEIKVKERTQEVVEKSEEILNQAHIIEQQNKELIDINNLLKHQAAEIARMNVLLASDNVTLKSDIEKVTTARAMSTELSFEEFSARYPDQETCYKLLSELKWPAEFKCSKCHHDAYKKGRSLYSRRCTRCNYEESVLHNTIFQNNRIPINKAFYIVYLVYTSKGQISSYQLAEKLDIRQSTCWHIASKIKHLMVERKHKIKRNEQQGWTKLVLYDHEKAPVMKAEVN